MSTDRKSVLHNKGPLVNATRIVKSPNHSQHMYTPSNYNKPRSNKQ